VHPSITSLARCAAMLLAVAGAGAHAGLPRYACTPLATTGDGQFAEPSSINKYGRVVGRASFPTDSGLWTWSGVQWKDEGHARRLDELLPPGYTGAEARAISDGNLIVGIAQPECVDECWPTHPAAWHGRTATLLPMPQGSRSGRANAVNRHGRIVGHYMLPDSFTQHAAMWHGGRLRDLGTLGSRKNASWQYSTATAVNDAGTIVGFSQTDSTLSYAALWDADGQVHNLGGLPGAYESQAWSVNDSGVVVGNSDRGVGSLQRAVAWVDGGIVDLDRGVPDGVRSTAMQVNGRGAIVGYKLKLNGSVAALYWPRWDHKPVHLADLVDGTCETGGETYTLGYTHGINNEGVIVSTGQSASGRTAGFRLTPRRAVPWAGAGLTPR
jgi:probable HAF family extracellular repeat protein